MQAFFPVLSKSYTMIFAKKTKPNQLVYIKSHSSYLKNGDASFLGLHNIGE